jgi:hydroxymethylpyrimidine/phosphomethylpyrimidine kinase
VPIVFDPVMVATSGALLADEATVAAFERLMRIAALVTPNAPELAALTGIRIEDLDQLGAAGRLLADRCGAPVLAKGGHLEGGMVQDLLFECDGRACTWEDSRIDTVHTHGSGCTLASAIATELGRGASLRDAIDRGRRFLRDAMRAAPGFGSGSGPMGHWSVRSDEG